MCQPIGYLVIILNEPEHDSLFKIIYIKLKKMYPSIDILPTQLYTALNNRKTLDIRDHFTK